MKTIKALLAVVGLCCASLAWADMMDDARGKREALLMGLYPPDLIMRHQQRLGITAEQRGRIQEAVQAFQSEVADLQWNLQSEQQQLKQVLGGYSVEAGQALPQAEKVLQLESEFKLAHFRMLIAIKNELTRAQIDMIRRGIRQKMAERGGGAR
jgi:hypothetical protein